MPTFHRRSVATIGLLIASAAPNGHGPSIAVARHMRGGVQLRELFTKPSIEGEPVECGLIPGGDGDERKLVMLTSSGLGVWGAGSDPRLVPNLNLTFALRELVLQLPDSAWAGGEEEGVRRKADAAKRSIQRLVKDRFRDGDLYSGLDVAVINDACFLKDSFWNEDNPNFATKSGLGLNYKVAGIRISPDVVRPFFGDQLDDGWCANFATDKPGYLGSLGFDLKRVHHISLWDSLATHDQTRALLELKGGQRTSHLGELDVAADMSTDAAKELMSRLAAADIVIVNGGNPDFLDFVLQHIGREAMAPVLDNVKQGRTIWLGQSAGSMVAGADMGLSYENGPVLLRDLDHSNTSGLGIVGKCAIRPHISDNSWSLTASVYGKLKHVNVVLLPNGNALLCRKGSCSRIGAPGALVSRFVGSDDPHLERLTNAFAPAAAAANSGF